MANAPLQQFVPSKETCKAHRHMTPTQYALWDVCMGLSHTTRVLYFDGRKLSARFQQFSKSACYRAAEALLLAGWFEPLEKKQKRTQGGTYAARRYKVLSHDEWVTKHGAGKCFKGSITVPASGTGESTVPKIGGLPFPNQAPTVPKTGGLPFPPAGHSLVVKPLYLASSLAECETAQKSSDSQGQEITCASNEVYPAVPASGTGVRKYAIPDYAEYDAREGWGARRDIGRPTTAEEIAEIKRLNREHVKPPSIQ